MRRAVKKLFYFALSAVFILNFAFNCSAQTKTTDRPLKVVTSFYPVYVTALNVCFQVPGVSVENLTGPSAGCLHDYALTTGQMKKLARANCLVINGALMESFLEKVSVQYPRLKVINLSEGIDLIKEANTVNPHVWVSPSGVMAQVRNMARAMEAFDPAHGGRYNENATAYLARLQVLKEKMHQALLPYQGCKIVTFHEAFPYLAREFGFRIVAVIEREPGSQPSAREVARTVDLIRQNAVKWIFAEPQYPSSPARVIARETGAKVTLLDPAVTGAEEPEAYIRIMEKNLRVLKEAFETTESSTDSL